MLVLTYVYRIRPTAAQHVQLSNILANQRYLYNAALEERIAAWKRGLAITMNDQTKSLTAIRAFDPDYGGVPYNLSKWTLKRLDDAMKGFFRRAKARAGKAGFPRFRSAYRWRSFGFNQIAGLRLIGRKLVFSDGLSGWLDLKLHRALPRYAVLKSATFTKDGRHWRAALTVAVDAPPTHVRPGTSCGVDLGVEALATLSDGTRFENVRPRRSMRRRSGERPVPSRVASEAPAAGAKCARGWRPRIGT